MLFFQIQEAFLFLPKIFFQFSAQNFFWIDQVLSKMNVRKEETIFRLESKISCREFSLYYFVSCHFSFLNRNAHNFFSIKLWFLISFKVKKRLNSLSIVFIFHTCRTFCNSFMLFVNRIIFKIFKVLFWIYC